jgi:hypothetical protein
MFTSNKIAFEITELDGEFFYQAQQGAVHPQSLKKVIRLLDIPQDHIRVYDPKNGVFSVVGEDEDFLAKMRNAETTEELMDLLFA